MMRWWWFGVAAEKSEILRELEQMKADGIGGVELAFVYPQAVDDSSKGLHNDLFLSPAMLENVHYAQQQARKIGLRVDVTLGSGWPFGGPATTLDEAAHRLRVTEIALPSLATELPQLKLDAGDNIISVSIVDGEPRHWNAASAKTVSIGAPVPQGSDHRTALFFIDSHTKQVVKRASAGAEGWVLDPFQKKAVDSHLKSVGLPLVSAFQDQPPYAIFSDSLEAYGADWTPALPVEFKRRRGYDLLPHLPELVQGGTSEAEKVRHDWGKTLTELVNENYLIPITDWAAAHHTKFRSQTYGDPAVTLSSQRLVTLAEGEGPYWRRFNTLRWASSANHLYEKNVTSAETFTWLHSPVFRATPLDMKAEADLHFIVGTNLIIGHGWPYSSPQAGDPGWSLYAAAAFNDHNPWHPVMSEITGYIQRVSSLLRQGKPANQVALLLPTDDAWASFTPGHVTVTGALARMLPADLIPAILDAGYNFDFIDMEAIGRVGIPYSIVVVPPTTRISETTLRSLQQYVARGGKVISVGQIPSLSPEGKQTAMIGSLVQMLFKEKQKSFVATESQLGDALHAAVSPDMKLTSSSSEIGFIRRKLADADIYFLANTSNHAVMTSATFASTFNNVVVIDPSSGEKTQGKKTGLPLELEPYESRIIVISNASSKLSTVTSQFNTLLDLTDDWKVHFSGIGHDESMSKPTDWISSSATVHYSGEAAYKRTFTLTTPADKTIYLAVEGGRATTSETAKGHPGTQAWYEGPVREAAVVFINGQKAGSLWHPPYRLDITKFLRSGENTIELRVYNTAINAWSALPPHDYKPLIAQYGDRFQMQDLNKVKPESSGILGTIKLLSTAR